MSRTGRILSVANYYHLIIRGNGKQILFEEETDNQFFLALLKKYSIAHAVLINAYCLMENHVHLLIHDPDNRKSQMMHDLEICYAGYFNEKYERCGHLFQGRFMSEAVNTQEYYLTVFRYILNNPVKAGICPVNQYKWSSYALYDRTDSFVDTTVLVKMIGNKDMYEHFLTRGNQDRCMEYDDQFRNDAWAKDVIHQTLGLANGFQLQTYDKKSRDEAIRLLKKEGVRNCQIERLTGISHSIVHRA